MDVLSKASLNPKVSKKNYHTFPLGFTNKLVQTIWNNSVLELTESEPDFRINNYLIYEEIKAFSSTELFKDILLGENFNKSKPGIENDITEKTVVQILSENGFNKDFYKENMDFIYLNFAMNFPLNISGLLDYMENNEKELTSDFKRYIEINNFIKAHNLSFSKETLENDLKITESFAKKIRKEKSFKLPVEKIVITEGATEEKLLPLFAQKFGYDFDKNGVFLIEAGGKNKVERLYSEYYKKFKMPIFILLDKDAQEQADMIKEVLRSEDELHIIDEGEFEDILNIDLIKRAVNKFHKLEGQISINDLRCEEPMAKNLYRLWQEKGFGDFSKVEFASIIAENISKKEDVSCTLANIITKIKEL